MKVSLLSTIATLQANLTEAQASLAWVRKYLPADMLARVVSCEQRADETVVTVECEAGDLERLLAAFPLRTDPQYLAARDGTPVSRAEALSLRHPHAAAPVHPAWARQSAVLGSAACWRAEVDGQAVVVQAQGEGFKAAQSLLWAGYTVRVQGVSYVIFERPLPKLTLNEGPSPDEMPMTLKEVVSYLNGFLARERPNRRGAAPAELLAWFACKQFGIPVHVTEREIASLMTKRVQRYSVSIPDSRGKHWHELSQVELPIAESAPDDAMWYDLIER